MDCFEVRGKMILYLKGELPALENQALDVHLKSCSECCEFLEEEEEMLNFLKGGQRIFDVPIPDIEEIIQQNEDEQNCFSLLEYIFNYPMQVAVAISVILCISIYQTSQHGLVSLQIPDFLRIIYNLF